MVAFKEDPKGLLEAIRRAVGIVEGLVEVFPGGTVTCEYVDGIVSLTYRKEWRVDNCSMVMVSNVEVNERAPSSKKSEQL